MLFDFAIFGGNMSEIICNKIYINSPLHMVLSFVTVTCKTTKTTSDLEWPWTIYILSHRSRDTVMLLVHVAPHFIATMRPPNSGGLTGVVQECATLLHAYTGRCRCEAVPDCWHGPVCSNMSSTRQSTSARTAKHLCERWWATLWHLLWYSEFSFSVLAYC